MSSTYVSVTDTAKLLRAALKDAFPGVKFSVRSDSYAGGASIRVGWTDGPRERLVKKVTRGFEGATFDGMIDLMSYHSVLVDGVVTHYGADFIFTNRHYSLELLTAAAEKVSREWGYEMPAVVGPNEWRGARLDYQGTRDDQHIDRLVQIELEGNFWE